MSTITESGRHPIHITHLVFGLLFLGLVSGWAAMESGLVDSTDLRWLVPLPWVVAGAAGLVAATLGGRRTTSLPDPAYRDTTPDTTKEL